MCSESRIRYKYSSILETAVEPGIEKRLQYCNGAVDVTSKPVVYCCSEVGNTKGSSNDTRAAERKLANRNGAPNDCSQRSMGLGSKRRDEVLLER